jgi:hypothetical protein
MNSGGSGAFVCDPLPLPCVQHPLPQGAREVVHDLPSPLAGEGGERMRAGRGAYPRFMFLDFCSNYVLEHNKN